MAALLVMLGVMTILMTAALPAWRFQAKREKELELVFRGEQYMRAIGLWERKMGPGSRPPTLDALVQQRFIRKKYKDPMTPDGEFQPLYAGVNPTPGIGAGRAGQPSAPPRPPPPGVPSQPGAGGIMGVTSKSKEASIRNYRGGTHYNEWRFIFAGLSNQPGRGGVGGQQRPGMPGGPGRGIGPGNPSGPFGPGGPRGSEPFGPGRGRGFPPGGGRGLPQGGRGPGGPGQ